MHLAPKPLASSADVPGAAWQISPGRFVVVIVVVGVTVSDNDNDYDYDYDNENENENDQDGIEISVLGKR